MKNDDPIEQKKVVHITRLQGTLIMLILVGVSLLIGMIGFHKIADLDWTDSFLNASMLLTGMGPVDEPESDAGKIFAGVYALYSGILFLSAVAIFIFPIIEHMGKHVAFGRKEPIKDCD